MYLILADLHQGLSRKTGVTPSSLAQLEKSKITDLSVILARHQDKEVIIAGDLFDSSAVSYHAILETATTLLEHPQKVWIIAGNHDLSKNTEKISSLYFMSEWLSFYPDNSVRVIFKPTMMGNMLLLPHMSNQDIFDAELARADGAEILITHCNYENHFTLEKDHSLNLTKKQASKFKLVISGHEHNKRTVGNVHMVGSFAPCNVGEASVGKFSHILDPKAKTIVQEEVEFYTATYSEKDWTEITSGDVQDTSRFLKITGEATAAQAPTVLSAVAALRKKSSAYMIQNAVTVDTLELGEIEGASFDSVNTWELLGKILKPSHKAHLKELDYVVE